MYMYHFMLILFHCAFILISMSCTTHSPSLGYKGSCTVLRRNHQGVQGLLLPWTGRHLYLLTVFYISLHLHTHILIPDLPIGLLSIILRAFQLNGYLYEL